MNKVTRWSTVALLAFALFPIASYARPIHAATHMHTGVVRDRSPHVQSHESILHHA